MAIGVLGLLASPHGKALLLEVGVRVAPLAVDVARKRWRASERYHGGSITIDYRNMQRVLNGARRVAATPQVRGMLVQVEQKAHRRARHLEEELSVQPEPQVRARLSACMAGWCALGSACAALSSALEDGTDERHAYAMA